MRDLARLKEKLGEKWRDNVEIDKFTNYLEVCNIE